MRTTKKWATREQHEREILKPDVALKSVLWRSLLRDNSRARQTTVGQNQVVLKHLIIDFPTSLGVSERANESAQRSKGSSAEQANDWAVGANERTDERVAQYSVTHVPILGCSAPLCKRLKKNYFRFPEILANFAANTKNNLSSHEPMNSWKVWPILLRIRGQTWFRNTYLPFPPSRPSAEHTPFLLFLYS